MGDIYMIAAESAHKSGNSDKALKHLNSLRESRGLDILDVTGDVLFNEIKEERTKELAFEGNRLWDLRRWDEGLKRMPPQKSNNPISESNDDVIGTSFLSNVSDFDLEVDKSNTRWIWPIPYNELTTNINIKNQQNPGW